jgi:hypothetical protein
MYPEYGQKTDRPLAPPSTILLKDGTPVTVYEDIPPVSQTHWVQLSAHDTAKECETAHAALLASEHFKSASGEEVPRYRITLSRCVPAEYVYPNGGESGYSAPTGASGESSRWHRALDALGVPR